LAFLKFVKIREFYEFFFKFVKFVFSIYDPVQSGRCWCVVLDGIAYTFGSQRDGGGVMTLTYRDAERADTRRDELAFGITTSQRDAVIVHVVSANSNDYISLELVRTVRRTTHDRLPLYCWLAPAAVLTETRGGPRTPLRGQPLTAPNEIFDEWNWAYGMKN